VRDRNCKSTLFSIVLAFFFRESGDRPTLPVATKRTYRAHPYKFKGWDHNRGDIEVKVPRKILPEAPSEGLPPEATPYSRLSLAR